MNKEQKKLNILGKSTFILACIFAIIFIASSIYTVWMIGDVFNGWDYVIKMSASVGLVGIIKIFVTNMILPVIYSIIFGAYIILLGRGKNIGKGIIAFSIFIMTFEIAIDVVGVQIGRFYTIPINSIISRCALIYILVVSLINIYSQVTKRFFSISAICSMSCLLLTMVIYYLSNIRSVFESLVYSDGINFLIISLYYLFLPILGLVTAGFVMGYIIYPEKYFKTLE